MHSDVKSFLQNVKSLYFFGNLKIMLTKVALAFATADIGIQGPISLPADIKKTMPH